MGDLEESEVILHEALHMAVEDSDNESITYIYDILANLALQRRQYEKAEQLFRSVLQRHAAGQTFIFNRPTIYF